MMPESQPSSVARFLRTALGPEVAGPPDAELVARFAAARDEAAFELLVWRHGGMVRRVCRAVLRDEHAAEDAAQAVFLVLARKAAGVGRRGAVVGWLYRVARRLATRSAGRRRPWQPLAADVPAAGQADPDLLRLVQDEVARLPGKYRLPVLLCFFEGLSHADAAARLGWPVGTVAGRVARAKDLLGRRLTHHGITAPAALLVLAPAEAVGAGFVAAAARAAVPFALGRAAVPGVSDSVLHLAKGATTAMTLQQLKWVAALTACGLAGVGVVAQQGAGIGPPGVPVAAAPADPPKPAAPKPAAPKPAEAKPEKRLAGIVQQKRSFDNLKLIGLAWHNYESAYTYFPHDIRDEATGKPLLSWRVAILPFIDQDELYKQFKLNEPWDSDHNKRLLPLMPDVYRVGFEPPGAAETHYQTVTGRDTLHEPGRPMRVGNVTDGLSNTLMVIEAGPPVAWTKPADLPHDPRRPPDLVGPFDNQRHAVMGDGAVFALRSGLRPTDFLAVATRNAGEAVDIVSLKAPPLALDEEGRRHLERTLKRNGELVGELTKLLGENATLHAEAARRKLAAGTKSGQGVEVAARINENLRAMIDRLEEENKELRKAIRDAKE